MIWLVICWAFYISAKVPGELKKWLYFIVSMSAFFFYGIHETSFYDLAPVMTAVIIIYYASGLYGMGVAFGYCQYDLGQDKGEKS